VIQLSGYVDHVVILFVAEMQQNHVQSAASYVQIKTGWDSHKIVLSFHSVQNILNIPLKVKVGGCMGNTHAICYQSTVLAGSKKSQSSN